MSCNKIMNEIIHNKLWVGDSRSSVDALTLKKNNISAVITVRSQLSNHIDYYKDHGIDVLHLSLGDNPDTNIGQFFPGVFHFIEKYNKKGKAVLIHCWAGISRSTTLIISYVMRKGKMNVKDAIKYVRDKRPCTEPNKGFLKQLNVYHDLLQKNPEELKNTSQITNEMCEKYKIVPFGVDQVKKQTIRLHTKTQKN